MECIKWLQFHHHQHQCDQIGQFIGLWATFQSLCQQLVYPNLPHYEAIFVKVSKSLIFQVKSFLGNFYTHLQIFTGHTDQHTLSKVRSTSCVTFVHLSTFTKTVIIQKNAVDKKEITSICVNTFQPEFSNFKVMFEQRLLFLAESWRLHNVRLWNFINFWLVPLHHNSITPKLKQLLCANMRMWVLYVPNSS